MHANNLQARESEPVAASAQGLRVALLARNGIARNALREDLQAAGTQLVLEGDLQHLDPSLLRHSAPEAVLVALDGQSETLLPRFDDVLLDSTVLTIYEEAELVASRDAWERSRWIRHLSAKLHRHGDVLPPRPFASQSEPVAATLDGQAETGLAEIPDVAGATPNAVLVLAGMGGPDALRQLLAALPPAFDRPLLIRQRLYGGRYDHLLRQLTRVSALPVQLAQAGDTAQPGHAYLLPEGVIATVAGSMLRFDAGDTDDFALLPAAGNAALLLSGCETGLAQAAAQWAQGGAWLAAQSPDTCFDGAAAHALIAAGGEVAAPAELAQRLLARA